MKIVYLVRHGKAEPKGTAVPDFNRALVTEGKEISRIVAERLKKAGVEPQILISSPALRAYETACVFAKVFNYRIKLIRTRKSLYDSNDCSQFLEIIQLLDDSYDNAMIFGHNPTLTDFALFLNLHFREDIPKSGVVGIEFDIDSWKDINGGTGGTVLFDSVKDIGNKDTGNKEKKDEYGKIASELATYIKNFFEAKNSSAAGKMKKFIEKASVDFAKRFIKETGK